MLQIVSIIALGLLQLSTVTSATTPIFVYGPGIADHAFLQFDQTSYGPYDAHLVDITNDASNIETNYASDYWQLNSTGLFSGNYYAHEGATKEDEVVFIPYNSQVLNSSNTPVVLGTALSWGIGTNGNISALSSNGYGPPQPLDFYACPSATVRLSETDYATAKPGLYLTVKQTGLTEDGCTPVTLNINAGLGAAQSSSSASVLTMSATASASGTAATAPSSSTFGYYTNSSSTTYAPATTVEPIEYTLASSSPSATTSFNPFGTVQPIEYTLTTATATATPVDTSPSNGGGSPTGAPPTDGIPPVVPPPGVSPSGVSPSGVSPAPVGGNSSPQPADTQPGAAPPAAGGSNSMGGSGTGGTNPTTGVATTLVPVVAGQSSTAVSGQGSVLPSTGLPAQTTNAGVQTRPAISLLAFVGAVFCML